MQESGEQDPVLTFLIHFQFNKMIFKNNAISQFQNMICCLCAIFSGVANHHIRLCVSRHYVNDVQKIKWRNTWLGCFPTKTNCQQYSFHIKRRKENKHESCEYAIWFSSVLELSNFDLKTGAVNCSIIPSHNRKGNLRLQSNFKCRQWHERFSTSGCYFLNDIKEKAFLSYFFLLLLFHLKVAHWEGP